MSSDAILEQGHNRTLITLAVGGFASQASVRLCDPMLPQLSAELGGSLGQAAQTITAFAVAYGLFQLVHGPMGDSFGKLRWVRYAVVVAAIASAACMLAGTLLQLVALRFFAGAACSALIPLSLAWIGDGVPYHARQRVLAHFLTGSTSGVVFGQVAGGVLADTIGWRLTFGFPAVVLAGVGLVLMLDARRATRVQNATESASGAVIATKTARVPLPSPKAIAAQFGSVLAVPWARVILTVVTLEGLLVFGAFAYVPSWLHLRYELPLWQCGLAAAGFGLGGLSYVLASSWLIARLGQRGLILGGAVFFALGMLALGGQWWPAQTFFCALAGMGYFMLHNTLQVFATQMAPQIRGTAIAAFAVGLFGGQSVGVALGAVLVETIGFESVLVGATLLLIALALALAVLVERHNHAAG
ncbi:MAG: MFS transporter [Krumholzibacteria bacterium]|nr:MFS transporter [Candidatus Krumholzibacteria bacterium]